MKTYSYIDWSTAHDLFFDDEFLIIDHFGGFDQYGKSVAFDILFNEAKQQQKKKIINTQTLFPQKVKINYNEWLDIRFSVSAKYDEIFYPLENSLECETTKDFKNFVCSFNGSEHLSRQWLVAALYKFGWFDLNYNSKNFSFSPSTLDGNISGCLSGNDERLYRKFIMDESTEFESFCNLIHGFEYTEHRFNLPRHMTVLSSKINQSFIQIVSETLGNSYVPFVTEKFLYPTITKSLWIGYAQPGYHDHIDQIFGFKKYNKIFDYSFDNVQNPVQRLIALLSMLAKFEKLSKADWEDLYLLEQDTIEYNYYHLRSKNYLKVLNNYNNL